MNVNNVLTVPEVAEELKLNVSGVRRMFGENGKVDKRYYRKTGKVILIDIKWLEMEKKKRNIK